jgi:hypothetical protein
VRYCPAVIAIIRSYPTRPVPDDDLALSLMRMASTAASGSPTLVFHVGLATIIQSRSKVRRSGWPPKYFCKASVKT